MATALTVWFIYTLDHAWLPDEKRFLFSFEGVGWVDQEIHNIHSDYFLTFHFISILDACQATTISGTDGGVRFSYFSFQYANMLLGEYEYNNDTFRHPAMRVLLFGIFIPLGLLLFIYRTLVQKPIWPINAAFFTNSRAVLCVLILGEALTAYYVACHPVCCSADFRFLFYLTPWIGYAVGKGLSLFPGEKSMVLVTSLLLLGYAVSSVALLVDRLVLYP
jgi:hypothetical protein